jgi:hypothetical protein
MGGTSIFSYIFNCDDDDDEEVGGMNGFGRGNRSTHVIISIQELVLN